MLMIETTMQETNRSSIPHPLRVLFVTSCMDVGGAEVLLAALVRGMDRIRFLPELCCLKHPGVLGEQLAAEIPVFSRLIRHKFDLSVRGRLARLMGERKIDAVVTVGTGGDKMFWGRLAAAKANIPVVLSALHSSGVPDRVEWPNRLLTARDGESSKLSVPDMDWTMSSIFLAHALIFPNSCHSWTCSC